MDPINYAEHGLPKIEYTEYARQKVYYTVDVEQHDDLIDEFLDYVCGNCCAITYNDEILYNIYPSLSETEKQQQEIKRVQIIDDPQDLFAKIFASETQSRVIVYIGDSPMFVAFYYQPNSNFFYVEYYKSKKYEEDER